MLLRQIPRAKDDDLVSNERIDDKTTIREAHWVQSMVQTSGVISRMMGGFGWIWGLVRSGRGY